MHYYVVCVFTTTISLVKYGIYILIVVLGLGPYYYNALSCIISEIKRDIGRKSRFFHMHKKL